MNEISKCRLCGSPSLAPVFSLGKMAFSGVFPKSKEDSVPVGELTIVLCAECALAQLDRNFPSDEMYGDNYGYMSSLNKSMVEHLKGIAVSLAHTAELREGDLVLDIGSNDGTMLSFFQTPGIIRVGIDPTVRKFKSMYPPDVISVPELFSASVFKSVCPDKRAKVISTVAMFYDLPSPAVFAQEVREVLLDDGFWHIEVSYGPWMLETGAFDAVCHEHVEYYSLKTLKRILDGAGFKISHISFNDTNGGSISITSTPTENALIQEATDQVNSILATESQTGCNTIIGWKTFELLVKSRLSQLEEFLILAKSSGKRVVALGASTKGNVLLQSLNSEALSAIAVIGEVNKSKFGKVTPGTFVDIVPESVVIESQPDFIVVLPWHFKDFFLARLSSFTAAGGNIVFPLPQLEIIGFDNG